jgi:hypothetical protein
MTRVHDQQPVETLGSDSANEPFRDPIWREPSIAPLTGGAPQTFRVTHPFHPLSGRTFQLIECRQTWGEYRVFFHDDGGL